jgi:hypothetical protein
MIVFRDKLIVRKYLIKRSNDNFQGKTDSSKLIFKSCVGKTSEHLNVTHTVGCSPTIHKQSYFQF